MTYAARPTDFYRPLAPARPLLDIKARPRPGIFTRLFNAVFESRQRQAEREVEAYLARTGHRFTDSIERELNERLFSGDWTARRS